jgi:amino acid permease
MIFSMPRTLDKLSWMSVPSVISIIVAGLVGMIGAGLNPVPGRVLDVVRASDFTTAFISITNPVFSYAGHFMFFILISEMKDPRGAMKAAYTLQGFATGFYIVFAIVMYYYIGSGVASPAFSSLPPVWAKAAYGIAIPNFLIAGSLYAHTAAKLIFVRLFRRTRHLHDHSVVGWGTWTFLIFLTNALAFLLAVGVPIFNYLIGIAASLFASWYTYGIAGFFWLYDCYHKHGGYHGLRERWVMTALNVLTVLCGAFICVAGMYVTIWSIIQAYNDGTIPDPFSC